MALIRFRIGICLYDACAGSTPEPPVMWCGLVINPLRPPTEAAFHAAALDRSYAGDLPHPHDLLAHVQTLLRNFQV